MADDLKRPGTLATAMLLALSVVAAACAKQSEVVLRYTAPLRYVR